MKKLLILFSMLIFIFCIIGCGTVSHGETVTSSDIPTSVPEEATEDSMLPQNDQATATLDAWQAAMPTVSHVRFGFADVNADDTQILPYYYYTGGEMRVGVNINIDHNVLNGELEVGVFLFLDGQLQPYRTEEETEYSYMHTFLSRSNEPQEIDLYFMPIAGQEGDSLNLETVCILYPNYRLEDGQMVWRFTGLSGGHLANLHFQANPEKITMPTTTERVLSLTQEIRDESQLDAQKAASDGMQYNFSVANTAGHSLSVSPVYNVSFTDPQTVQLAIWGDDGGEYGLTLFVNHEPVTIHGDNQVDIRIESGKKTVVTYQLDISDLEDNAVVYGILAAKNFKAYEDPTGAQEKFVPLESFYLTKAPSLWDILGISDPYEK